MVACMHAYRKIDNRCSDEGPVTAKMCISNIGTQDWSQPNGADPIRYIIWFLDGAFLSGTLQGCLISHSMPYVRKSRT
ncbi:hypothetical protein OIU77_014656, partial [Salix suchowensis]